MTFCWDFGGMKAVSQQTSNSSFEFPLKPSEMDVHMDPVAVATFSDHPYCEYLAYTGTSGTKHGHAFYALGPVLSSWSAIPYCTVKGTFCDLCR